MLDIILGILLGALGGWWLTRRGAAPTGTPYTPPRPAADKMADEGRIVLPGWEAEPLTSEGDISETVGEEAAAEEAVGDTPAGPVIEAYCVRCKTQRPMSHVESYTTANGRLAVKGSCPVCGAGMFKFVKE